MIKTIEFKNGEYFSEALNVVLNYAVQKGVINKEMSELLLEQELTNNLFADANVNLTQFGKEFFRLVNVKLRTKIGKYGDFEYTLTFKDAL